MGYSELGDYFLLLSRNTGCDQFRNLSESQVIYVAVKLRNRSPSIRRTSERKSCSKTTFSPLSFTGCCPDKCETLGSTAALFIIAIVATLLTYDAQRRTTV